MVASPLPTKKETKASAGPSPAMVICNPIQCLWRAKLIKACPLTCSCHLRSRAKCRARAWQCRSVVETCIDPMEVKCRAVRRRATPRDWKEMCSRSSPPRLRCREMSRGCRRSGSSRTTVCWHQHRPHGFFSRYKKRGETMSNHSFTFPSYALHK